MLNNLDKNIGNKKKELLEYYRNRSLELIAEVKQTYGETDFKLRAGAVNSGLIEANDTLVKTIVQKAQREQWSPKDLLTGVLMTTYTNYIVMIESRNDVWPYEYMAFARRIGELWEPFCQLCWEHPINRNLNYFIPPLFKDVKNKLTKEIEDFIDKLKISATEKNELKRYYQKSWVLVTSGEVKLELDLHFEYEGMKYVVDFKSGFSSNEKGNTNRLLLVVSVYKILEENHKCLLFVRSNEERNNHYLQTLKNSGLWTVYCGQDTYKKIEEFSGFNLAEWMIKNVKWENDFDKEMYSHLTQNNLLNYLEW